MGPISSRRHLAMRIRRLTMLPSGLGALCQILCGVLVVASATAAPYRPAPGSEILWDRFGIAHVYAHTLPDMFYGFGWAQARSHGDLIARLYAEARGRAAEYYGADELEN